MKTRTLLGIICICLQLISFIGNSNSGSPIKLSFDSLELFLFDLIYLLSYCFIGIIGVILILWSVFSKNNKAKQHTENQLNKDIQKEIKVVNMVQEKTNSTENNVMNILVCPKCNIQLPDDSVFCPNCGDKVQRTNKQINEEKKIEPEIKVIEKVVVKKNKVNKILAVLLVLSLIVSSVLGYFTFTYYQQSNDYSKEVKELMDSNKILTNRYDETSVARDVLYELKSSENWGYATENFHTDTGILVLSKYSDAKEITLYSTYGGATFNMDNSEPNVASAIWTEESWYDNTTNIRIKPLKTGVSVITITNDKYDNEVKILIIVN